MRKKQRKIQPTYENLIDLAELEKRLPDGKGVSKKAPNPYLFYIQKKERKPKIYSQWFERQGGKTAGKRYLRGLGTNN